MFLNSALTAGASEDGWCLYSEVLLLYLNHLTLLVNLLRAVEDDKMAREMVDYVHFLQYIYITSEAI